MKGTTLLVVALFASLAGCWLFAPAMSEWLALGLMVCAGIPHGAFDLRVAERGERQARDDHLRPNHSAAKRSFVATGRAGFATQRTAAAAAAMQRALIDPSG